jgi:hypothetical protein
MNHFLFRVGDATHLWSSSTFNIWGIHSSTSGSKYFLKNAKQGDCLWFVKGNAKGLLVAVAIFEKSVKRVAGECISFEQLGWVNVYGNWDVDIHFKNFKKIENMALLSQIKGSAANPRIYNNKCMVNLPEMYSQIYTEPPLEQQSIKFIVDGVNYIVTTNADIQDENTIRFIDSLVSSESSDDEDIDEEICEEKESLLRILSTCKMVSNEIVQLTSLLNNRLENL